MHENVSLVVSAACSMGPARTGGRGGGARSAAALQAVLSNDSAYVDWQTSKAADPSNANFVKKRDAAVERTMVTRYESLGVRGSSVLCIGARA